MMESGKTIRHLVLKELTDRPGAVVYRDDIADATNINPAKVADTIRRMKQDHPEIGDDFDVVVQGQAWRYVPNSKTARALRAATSGSGRNDSRVNGKPMTHSLRDYFTANPNRLIYLDELKSAMSTDDLPVEGAKITVGISNAKIGNKTLRENLTTVVPGQAWQYNPPMSEVSVSRPQPQAAPAPTVVVAPAPVPTSSVAAPPVTQRDDKLLLLEELGEMADGSKLVRDDKQKMYKLIAL